MEWRRVTETERMPSLVVGDTERFGGNTKNCKRFPQPNTEPLPICSAHYRLTRNKTVLQPVASDVHDARRCPGGLVTAGLAAGRQVRRVIWCKVSR